MKYDDASWHYGGEFPKESPEEYGATHIALIMKWAFQKGWAGDIHTKDERANKELKKVIAGESSATKYFMDWCDGKLTNEDFTDEGNAFLESYYDKHNQYLSDYTKYFGDLMYVKGEAEHDFNKFSLILEQRHQQFVKPENPWWKFW